MKILIFVTLISSFSAHAWGPTGHRVVAEIAQRNLKPQTARKCNEILGGDSLAKVANWADEIKSEPQTYADTYNWHCMTWRQGQTEPQTERDSGELLKALKNQIGVLKNKKSSPEDKKFSLKFLVHLMGDLHQPLHVGNDLDRGASICKVFYFGEKFTLHQVVDEVVIDFTKVSYSELARFLMEGKSKKEIKKMQIGEIIDWARESRDLSDALYPPEVVNSKSEMKNYCGENISDKLMPRLSYEYNYEHLKTIHQRLLEAGVRLAGLLNQTL